MSQRNIWKGTEPEKLPQGGKASPDLMEDEACGSGSDSGDLGLQNLQKLKKKWWQRL